MKDITSHEMKFALAVLKSPEIEFNANNIAKSIEISSMGALKIASRLVKEKILLMKPLGRAKYYHLNVNNDYVVQYLRFLLKRENEQASPYIKRWISEIRKVKNADAAILFGSALSKNDSAKDIDILFVVNDKKFGSLKKEIEELNKLNDKMIHPLFQTKDDLLKNIRDNDKVICSALKGIAAFGEELIIRLYQK